MVNPGVRSGRGIFVLRKHLWISWGLGFVSSPSKPQSPPGNRKGGRNVYKLFSCVESFISFDPHYIY